MTDAVIPVSEGTAGPLDKIDVEQLTVGANTVYRQRVQLAGAAALEIARVKNALPLVTDYGGVVRPASGLPDVTSTGNLTATAASSVTGIVNTTSVLVVPCAGMQSVSWTRSGTYAGASFIAEWSGDGGTNWMQAAGFQQATSLPPTATDAAADNSAAVWSIPIPGGAGHVRVRVVTLTSGTVLGFLRATAIPNAFTGAFLIASNSGNINATAQNSAMVEMQAAIAGGATPYSFISTAAVLSASIKASAGQVYSIYATNINAAVRYLRLYDQAGAPASTDGANIKFRGAIPAGALLPGGPLMVTFPVGKVFLNGIGIRCTAAVADSDATALAANDVLINIDWH